MTAELPIAAGKSFLFVFAAIWHSLMSLSLIHISEPTRPY